MEISEKLHFLKYHWNFGFIEVDSIRDCFDKICLDNGVFCAIVYWTIKVSTEVFCSTN